MIPSFEAGGNLPPGEHTATWPELVARYGTTPHRLRLLAGLREALEALRTAGCQRVFLDGSFITGKETPGDYDGCWDTDGVNLDLLEPVLLTFDNRRAAQKAKYLGEFFPARFTEGGSGLTFLDFFQVDKNTGQPKGIILLDLRELQP